MKKGGELLIVTPTLGVSRFLDEAMLSVHSLEVPARHIIICPNVACASVARRYPDCEVLIDSGNGIYNALNIAIDSVMAGDWEAFMWLNDDDTLHCKGVMKGWKALISNPNFDITYGRVKYTDSSGRNLGPLPICSKPQSLGALFAARVPAVTQQGTIIRKSVFGRIGTFDLSYRLAADFDFWARAINGKCRFHYIDELCGTYRLRRGQLSANPAEVRREIERSALAHFGKGARLRLSWSLACFKFARSGDLFRRILLTGRLRSASLFAMASRREVQEEG